MYAKEKDTCREPNEEDHVHNKESTNFSKNHLTIIKERTSVLRTGSNGVGPVSTVLQGDIKCVALHLSTLFD